jgi:hypothetical protein
MNFTDEAGQAKASAPNWTEYKSNMLAKFNNVAEFLGAIEFRTRA